MVGDLDDMAVVRTPCVVRILVVVVVFVYVVPGIWAGVPCTCGMTCVRSDDDLGGGAGTSCVSCDESDECRLVSRRCRLVVVGGFLCIGSFEALQHM